MRRLNRLNKLLATTVSLVVLVVSVSYGQLSATFDKAQTFLGGRKAIMAYSKGSDYFMIDFSKNPLALEKICSDGTNEYRSLSISPDGKWMVICPGKKVTIRPVEANATKKISVDANGKVATFWIHPQTKKWYVIWGDATTFDTKIKEFDPVAGAMVGSARVLLPVFSGDKTANGGRSPDGKYMSGDDAVHGSIELNDPLSVTGTTLKYWLYYTSNLGWRGDNSHLANERYAGWCNGNLSPSQPGAKWYACAQHMGSEHTDCFIRSWPADLNNLGPIKADNSCVTKPEPNKYCVPGNVEMRIRPKDGQTHFHGTFWATHEDYIVAKISNNKAASSWAVYVYDISVGNDGKYLKILDKHLNKGNDFANLWVEQGGLSAVPGRAAAAQTTRRSGIRSFEAGKGVVSARVESGGTHRVELIDMAGRVVGRRAGSGAARYEFSTGTTATGIYLLRFEADGAARQSRLLLNQGK